MENVIMASKSIAHPASPMPTSFKDPIKSAWKLALTIVEPHLGARQLATPVQTTNAITGYRPTLERSHTLPTCFPLQPRLLQAEMIENRESCFFLVVRIRNYVG